jgi:hypothetical protein
VALGEPQEFLRLPQTRPRERVPQQHGDELADGRPQPLGLIEAVSRSASAAGCPMWGGRIAAMIAATWASVGSRATPAQARGHAGGDVLAHGLPVDPGAAGESVRTQPSNNCEPRRK